MLTTGLSVLLSMLALIAASLRVSFMLPFRAFTLFGWLVGMVPLMAIAEESDWSHRYPPPVKVAPLVRPDVQQASHTTEILPADHTQWSEESFQPVPDVHQQYDASGLAWRSPPHRTIEAPQVSPKGARHASASSHSAITSSHTAPINNGHSVQGLSAHGTLLPSIPGVVNDPSAAGPGHAGLGTHWIRQNPQQRQAIPDATVAPRWKAPYSYGHFGAEGKRHWTRQHGYRDRYLQWTLR